MCGFVNHLLGTVPNEVLSWATKYHLDVHYYIRGKYHELGIANFTEDTNSGHIIYWIGPLFVCLKKRKETYILHIIYK